MAKTHLWSSDAPQIPFNLWKLYPTPSCENEMRGAYFLTLYKKFTFRVMHLILCQDCVCHALTILTQKWSVHCLFYWPHVVVFETTITQMRWKKHDAKVQHTLKKNKKGVWCMQQCKSIIFYPRIIVCVCVCVCASSKVSCALVDIDGFIKDVIHLYSQASLRFLARFSLEYTHTNTCFYVILFLFFFKQISRANPLHPQNFLSFLVWYQG